MTLKHIMEYKYFKAILFFYLCISDVVVISKVEEQASVGGLSGTNVTVTAHWALWVFFCALINCKTCSGKVWIWLVSGGMISLFENI